MINYIKRLFCKHPYKLLAYHECSNQTLWQCEHCRVYYIQHHGLGIGYKINKPNIGGWIYDN